MKRNAGRGDFYGLILLFIYALCSSSCSSRYVGRAVTDMNADTVCKISSLPASCSYNSKNFSINYTIEETGNLSEYFVEGTAQYIGGITFTKYTGASFTLLIVDTRFVVEEFGMVEGSGSLGTSISFSRKFTTPWMIEAAMLWPSMTITDR